MDRNSGGNSKVRGAARGTAQGQVNADAWLTTGEMARLSETTLRTVRFYEAEGLITSQLREGGTHRKFSAPELKKLQIILDLRDSGMSLQEIKSLMALKGGGSSAEKAACAMSTALCAQVQELDRRIATLQRVRSEFSGMVDMLKQCRTCTNPTFPVGCGTCDRTAQPETARATQLLWKN